MITDMSTTHNNWIYQNNKLIEASYSFTVLEQKLIRLLASMIKKDDDDFKEYKFKAKDLSIMLNIHQKNIYMELDKVTDKLMTRYIKIKNDNSEKFKKRHLIKIADFESGILTMKIDEDMKPLYLNLDWYTKYQLKNIMQFKSTYSFRLYELLKQYENIRYRVITIDNLRIVLEIGKNQYPKYSNLKQKVINVALNEINNNTDLHIEIEELKEVRKVISIKFYIKQNITKDNISDEIAATKEDSKDLVLIEQVQVIFHKHKITEHEAKCILKDSNNNLELIEQCYEYLLNKKKIDNIVGYMRKLVKGFNKPQKNIQGLFNEYPQRTYDFDDLENKLLGWK